jgi:hypothetical protein
MTGWAKGCAAAAALVLAAGALQAQDQPESENRVGANTDWSVFVEGDPQECWAVSAPKETVNTREGQVVAVQRGDILLFVTYRPNSNVSGEVAFTGGYPFADGSTVELDVNGTTFELFTDGEWAYPASPEEDARIVTAMKGGSSAVVAGRSGRGTLTTDTFSLLGFTASVDEAASRCAGN